MVNCQLWATRPPRCWQLRAGGKRRRVPIARWYDAIDDVTLTGSPALSARGGVYWGFSFFSCCAELPSVLIAPPVPLVYSNSKNLRYSRVQSGARNSARASSSVNSRISASVKAAQGLSMPACYPRKREPAEHHGGRKPIGRGGFLPRASPAYRAADRASIKVNALLDNRRAQEHSARTGRRRRGARKTRKRK
jgi:hypothetical protein